MTPMFERFSRLTVYLRWPLFILFMGGTVFFARQMPHLVIDPTMDSLFVKKSSEFEYYAEYRERYGSDQMVVVAMATPDLFTKERLIKLEDFSKSISEFPEVESVYSLASVMDLRHKFLGVEMVPAIDSAMTGNRKLDDLKKDILSNELFVKNLVSSDGKHATILIYLKPPKTVKGAKPESRDFMAKLHKTLRSYESSDMRFYLAGAPVEQAEFIRLIQRDQYIFVPLIVLLLMLSIYLIYHSLICVFLAMSTVLMTLVWTMGSIHALNQEINLVTSLLAPVIMIIAVVNSVHFINLFLDIRKSSRRDPRTMKYVVYMTMKQLSKPTFLAHFTTILGFASLMLNPVPAIQSFGLFASLGTFFSYVIHMVVIPVLLPMLPASLFMHVKKESWWEKRVVDFVEKIEYQMRRLIILFTILLVIVAYYGLQKLEVDTSLVKQLRPDSTLAKATRFIDDNITGVYNMAFVFRRKDGKPFLTHGALQKMDDFKTEIEKLDGVRKVNAITSLVKKIHSTVEDKAESYVIPKDDKRIDLYLNEMMNKSPADTLQWISHDFQELRMEARIRAVGTREGDALDMRIREIIRQKLSADFDCEVTGNITLLGQMAKKLVDYQLRSFGVSFFSILFLIVLLFRSVRVGLLAAIPNLLPILFVYAVMGFLKIELSMPTAMISGIVLGLVVDSSIHFIHRFEIEFKKRKNYLVALHHTYRHVGASLVTSTLILSVGFASSVFASVRPTVYFGVLTSLAIFIAMICTLIVMPVFLVWMKPFGPPKLFK